MKFSSHKMNRMQADLALAFLFQKGGNYVTQTLLNIPYTYIIVKRKNIWKWNTA